MRSIVLQLQGGLVWIILRVEIPADQYTKSIGIFAFLSTGEPVSHKVGNHLVDTLTNPLDSYPTPAPLS